VQQVKKRWDSQGGGKKRKEEKKKVTEHEIRVVPSFYQE
jgi:hypothetical protein